MIFRLCSGVLMSCSIHVCVFRSPQDSCLYLVYDHDPQALFRSSDELQHTCVCVQITSRLVPLSGLWSWSSGSVQILWWATAYMCVCVQITSRRVPLSGLWSWSSGSVQVFWWAAAYVCVSSDHPKTRASIWSMIMILRLCSGPLMSYSIHVCVFRSPQDSCLYLVYDHDPQALFRSFDELQLFEPDQATDIISVHNSVQLHCLQNKIIPYRICDM